MRRKRIEIVKENEESIEIDEIYLLCVRMSCILLFYLGSLTCYCQECHICD